jgi:hypothetical protein
VGSINAYILDNGLPIAGVTVLFADPSNNTFTAVSSPIYGIAAYNPSSVALGNWRATVPGQGDYGNSVIDFTVAAAGQYSVTFKTALGSLNVTPKTAETFPLNNPATIVENIQYVVNPAATLVKPLTLSLVNMLPNGWTSIFTSSQLSEAVTSGSVSIFVPSTNCGAPQTLQIKGTSNSDGVTVLSNNRQFIKAFPVTVTISISNSYCEIGPPPPYKYTNGLKLTSTNDCGVPWTIYVNGTNMGSLTNGNSLSLSSCDIGSTYSYSVSIYNSAFGSATGTSNFDATSNTSTVNYQVINQVF